MTRTARARLAIALAFVGLLAVGAAGWSAGALVACPFAQWHLDVDKAMDVVGLAPGMIVGEAGAGDGYFTLPMARRVGEAGAVYANDISRRSLASLERNAKRDGLTNIHTVVGDVDDARFPRTDLGPAGRALSLRTGVILRQGRRCSTAKRP